MGDYALSLSGDIAGGAMLTDADIAQWEKMLAACAGLNGEIAGLGDVLAREDLIAPDAQMWADAGDDAPRLEAISGEESGIEYPTLIYDGPFSDGRHDAAPKGVTGAQITLEEAMERARALRRGARAGRARGGRQRRRHPGLWPGGGQHVRTARWMCRSPRPAGPCFG